MRALAACALVVAVGGCSDKAAAPAPPGDGGRARRVFTKPPGTVRAVPPHAIRAEGVGPYLLGAGLKDVLGLLSRGPRVALIEIDDVIEYSLVQAEDDKLVIGSERNGGVSFVTVLDRDIARTESGAGVDAERAELDEALGARSEAANRAADPRIARFAALPNVRFVLDAQRVIAVAVTVDDRPPRVTPAPDAPAPAPTPVVAAPKRCATDGLRAAEGELFEASILGAVTVASIGCLDGSTPMAVVTAGDRLSVIAGDAGKTRRLRVDTPADLVFAAPIDVDGDGSDEVAIVTEPSAAGVKITRLDVHRVEGGRLQRVAGADVYRVTDKSARWAGAQLSQISLMLELRASENTVFVGGLYVQRDGRSVRIVAPLTEQRLSVRTRGQAEPASPTTPIDAGAPRDARKPPRPDAGPGARRRDQETPR